MWGTTAPSRVSMIEAIERMSDQVEKSDRLMSAPDGSDGWSWQESYSRRGCTWTISEWQESSDDGWERHSQDYWRKNQGEYPG